MQVTILEKSSNQSLKPVLKEFHKFYEAKKDKKGVVSSISVKYLELVRILKFLGFRRLDLDGESFTIRIDDNKVTQSLQNDVIDAFEDYLSQWIDEERIPDSDDLNHDFLINAIYPNLNRYFSDHVLNRLRSKDEIKFLEDTKNESFFCFQNGIVKVTKDKIELQKYETIEGKFIWQNQMLPRYFEPIPSSDYKSFSFVKFVSNISGNSYDEEKGRFKDPKRFQCFRTVIGYNLHRYFEGKMKATIFTDSTLSDNPNGRTGKTLLTKALGKMLNSNKWAKTYIELNGKNFDFTDKFRYQECGLDTKLVHINDAVRKFDFEQLFNDISEGIKAQKKNQSPFGLMAKIIISTNLTIRVNGDSARDRAVEIEMADYYSADYSPEDEFGEWFFRDWSKDDWNYFDNFMLDCVQEYLKHGLITPNMINLNERKLIEETAKELVEFMDEFIIEDGKEYDKAVIHHEFTKYFPDYTKLSQKKFTNWVKKYVELKPNYALKNERRSNGKSLISFFSIEKS